MRALIILVQIVIIVTVIKPRLTMRRERCDSGCHCEMGHSPMSTGLYCSNVVSSVKVMLPFVMPFERMAS